jgi:molecular chaperone GrpE
MGDDKRPSAGSEDDATQRIEVEFVDESTPVDTTINQLGQVDDDGAGEPIELGPSVEVEIERLEKELDELRDVHLRKLAEFDNFRKRSEREREDIRRTASEELICELLPVLDNFERALQHGNDAEYQAFRDGVEMIAKQLWDNIQRQGVEVIDPLGERFSPEYHEAVHRVEDEALEPGTVATVLAKGYTYNGRLIRPAMVGVASETSEGNALNGDESTASAGAEKIDE